MTSTFEASIEGDRADRDMDRYIDTTIGLTGFGAITRQQREGIARYYTFAATIMAPLLAFAIPEDEDGRLG
ncbi:hypothetical protein NIBR502774_19525 (plasmid) [Rhizobium sp. NIBRBAC000502774]|nr:hypothetical protein NIBR502774_19525 [Rhizobium sp. NIBRBAC000502774]